MGYSYYVVAGPRMCFNAAKMWQSGWFDAAETIDYDPTKFKSTTFHIGNQIDYPYDDGTKLILKLNQASISNDYYMTFNAAKSYNSGTKEGADKLYIVEAGEEGGAPSQSWKTAALKSGQSKMISNFDSSGFLGNNLDS